MPENWKTYKLSEVFEIIGGGTPKTKIKEYWDGNISWLSVVDFNNDQRTVFSTEKSITELGLQKSSTKILSKGQLIISARGTVGQIAQLGRDMAFNQSCYGLSGKEKLLINDFGYYLLKSSITNIQANSHGSVFDTITRNTFENIEAHIPEIEEQRSITSILSALDDKIELNLQMNKTLEEMAMALYKHWFVDFGPFQDGEFVASELGEIPKGWEVKSIGDLANILNSKRVPLSTRERSTRKGPFPYYGASGIIDNIDDYKFDGEYVIVSEDGENLRSRKTPIAFRAVGQFWVNNHAHILKGKKNGINEMIVCHFAQLDLNPFITGAVQPKLNKQNLLLIKIPVPRIEAIMDEVLEQFYSISRIIISNNFENQTLTQLRDTLLPKLISGEVRVKDAEKTLTEVL
ncbi:restriction endonuclease subunit S [Leeuwenhoekiella sp. A16]|uniref:restriction endonuclease subunit S n=1 Tax=unclassified Leeuwenhoekiella TaxID=2615029 RepID=UPI003A804414